MGDLTIKGLSDMQIAALEALALRNHRTLEEELRSIIAVAAVSFAPEKKALSMNEAKAQVQSSSLASSDGTAQAIRKDRDGG